MQVWKYMTNNPHSDDVSRWQKIVFVAPEKKDNEMFDDFYSEEKCAEAVHEIQYSLTYFTNKNKTAKCSIHLYLRDPTFLSKSSTTDNDMRQLLQELRTMLNTYDHTHASRGRF